jgi:RNA polymerase sigma factor (sigma-70 family)
MSDRPSNDPIADQKIFEDLFKDAHEPLLASLTGMVRDRNRAEEIAAVAFQRAWENRSQFRGDASLRTWLYAIGLNAARERAAHERTTRRDSVERLESPRYAEPDRASAALEDAERRAQIWKALDRIPAKCRRLLIEHHVKGRSLEEIARREGVPVGTIASRLFTARKLLREAWLIPTLQGGHMKEEHVRQMAQDALGRLASALEAGHSEALKEYLAAQARFHRYSWHNVMLITAQRPSASQVAGYHAWHQLGRFVKKGEKGIVIYAPVLVKDTDPQAGVREAASNDVFRLTGFRTAHVFDIAQTDGRELPAFAEMKGDPQEYTDKLKALVAKDHIALTYDPSIAPAKGVSFGGRIALRPGLSAAEEFSVLAHEFAHELLHKRTADRPLDKTVRETQAEAVAFVVCRGVGLDTNTAASDYIALYKGDTQTLAESLTVIHQASTRILNELLPEERQLPVPERSSPTPSTTELSEEPARRDAGDRGPECSAAQPDRSESMSWER